jgi:hypothetical protein
MAAQGWPSRALGDPPTPTNAANPTPPSIITHNTTPPPSCRRGAPTAAESPCARRRASAARTTSAATPVASVRACGPFPANTAIPIGDCTSQAAALDWCRSPAAAARNDEKRIVPQLHHGQKNPTSRREMRRPVRADPWPWRARQLHFRALEASRYLTRLVWPFWGHAAGPFPWLAPLALALALVLPPPAAEAAAAEAAAAEAPCAGKAALVAAVGAAVAPPWAPAVVGLAAVLAAVYESRHPLVLRPLRSRVSSALETVLASALLWALLHPAAAWTLPPALLAWLRGPACLPLPPPLLRLWEALATRCPLLVSAAFAAALGQTLLWILGRALIPLLLRTRPDAGPRPFYENLLVAWGRVFVSSCVGCGITTSTGRPARLTKSCPYSFCTACPGDLGSSCAIRRSRFSRAFRSSRFRRCQ